MESVTNNRELGKSLDTSSIKGTIGTEGLIGTSNPGDNPSNVENVQVDVKTAHATVGTEGRIGTSSPGDNPSNVENTQVDVMTTHGTVGTKERLGTSSPGDNPSNVENVQVDAMIAHGTVGTEGCIRTSSPGDNPCNVENVQVDAMTARNEASSVIKRIGDFDRKAKSILYGVYGDINDILTSENFFTEIKDEMRAEFGDLSEIFRLKKEEVNDDLCPIVITGETSSGKSSFVNLILGEDLLPQSPLICTNTICKIINSDEKMIVLTDNQDGQQSIYFPNDTKVEELQERLKEYISAHWDRQSYKAVDIYWPIPCLQKKIMVVDTPGIGPDDDELTQRLFQYLPSALAFIYIINPTNAGGIQSDRLQRILDEQDRRRQSNETRSLLDPRRAIFVCNKWDQVHEDEEEVFNYIRQTLKEKWLNFDSNNIYRLSTRREMKRYKKGKQISKNFKSLLEGIDHMIPACLEEKILRHVSWQKHFLERLNFKLKTRIANASRTLDEKRTMADRVNKRMEKLQANLSTIWKHRQTNTEATSRRDNQETHRAIEHGKAGITQKEDGTHNKNKEDKKSKIHRRHENKALAIQERLTDLAKEKCLNISKELHEHLHHQETRDRIFTFQPKEFPENDSMDIIDKEIIALIENKIHHEITLWLQQTNNGGFPTLIKEQFRQECHIIDEDCAEIDEIFLGQSLSGCNVEIDSHQKIKDTGHWFGLSKSTQIALIATSPLWAPLAAVFNLFSLPFGVSYVFSKLTENKRQVTNYRQRKAEYVKEIGYQMLEKLTIQTISDRLLKYILEEIESEVKLFCTKTVPKRIKADKMLLKRIVKDERGPEEVRKQCFIIDYDLRSVYGCVIYIEMKYFEKSKPELSPVRNEEASNSGKMLVNGEWIDTFKKKMKWSYREKTDCSMLRDITLLRNIRHKNIINVIGVNILPGRNGKGKLLQLQLEKCDANLETFIHCSTEVEPWTNMLEYLCQSLEGLVFLHLNGLTHRNIKPSNILIKYGTAKLSDIGVRSERESGDPRILLYEREYDVLRFGVLLWESWYRRSALNCNSCAPLKLYESLAENIQDGWQPDFDDKIPGKLASLIKICWKIDPAERLSAKTLFDGLTYESLL